MTVVVTWFIVRQVGVGFDAIRELDVAAWSIRPGVFTLASIVLVGGFLFSGLLWGRVVRDLGARSLSHRDAIQIFLIANLGRYIPGKVWQVAGLAVLARRRGVPGALAGVSAVVAHGASLAAAAIVGALVVVGTPWAPAGVRVLIPASAIAAALLLTFPPVLRALVRVAGRSGLLIDGSLLSPLVVGRWLGLFVLQWGLYGASFLLLARSLGLPGGALELITAYVAAYVLGYLAMFAPAGLGVREATLLALLAPTMGEAPAAGLAVVARVWSTVAEVIPAGILWGIELARGGRREEGRSS